MWLAVGLVLVVVASIGLALLFWRYGVSEHEEEMWEERRIERLLFRLIEAQQAAAKDQQETNVLLRQIAAELKPVPTGPVATRVQIAFTPPQ